MAYFLRFLLAAVSIGLLSTAVAGFRPDLIPFGHIKMAIVFFTLMIFVEAFVMFFFIGVSRMIENIYTRLVNSTDLNELFEEPPQKLEPYIEKVKRYLYQGTQYKRKVIPWTMLMLLLGMTNFFMGGAYDTGLVNRVIHKGTTIGFFCSLFLGIYNQWVLLGKSHQLLRNIKMLFGLPDSQM